MHKGLDTLDTVPHMLLEIAIGDPAQIHVVDLAAISNLHWLQPGVVSAAQRAFGDMLLAAHPLVVLPSVVSSHAWNLLIDVARAAKLFKLLGSEPFALDPAVESNRVGTSKKPSAETRFSIRQYLSYADLRTMASDFKSCMGDAPDL